MLASCASWVGYWLPDVLAKTPWMRVHWLWLNVADGTYEAAHSWMARNPVLALLSLPCSPSPTNLPDIIIYPTGGSTGLGAFLTYNINHDDNYNLADSCGLFQLECGKYSQKWKKWG
jgi:hypothetical protein